MPRAIARDATGSDLSSLGDKLAQDSDILVIDFERLIGAKSAHLSSDHGAPATAAPLVLRPFAAPSGS